MSLKNVLMTMMFVLSMSSNWAKSIAPEQMFTSFDDAKWVTVGDVNWSHDLTTDEIHGNQGKGFLLTKSSYRNFELRLEFWADYGSNSGVFFRCKDGEQINDKNCYEANIFDSRPDQSGGTGAIVNIASPKKMILTEGKWNTYIIKAIGDNLIVELNGFETVNVKNSLHQGGPIALQFAQGGMKFRNVMLKEIK